ncbi:MAG: hypothetical protein HY854_01515 [Burkholderiales bacterium]|nr:hypothetical protein [Burkholderiales bacterium]
MNFPAETKPVLWGAVGGAVALAIVGFSWAGWTTAGTAKLSAQSQVDAAVVGAMAPVCVDQFRRAGSATANMAELRALDNYAQGAYIEKGGWAALPGAKPDDRLADVARACAVLLVAPA